MQLSIYLFFKGQCFEAMSLYAKTLGGEILAVHRNADAAEDDRMPGGPDAVMNMAVKFDAGIVMASDSSEGMYQAPTGFRVQVDMPSLAEFDRVYGVLANGAVDVAMPAGETFWAERFAMFTDRFGTPWMLNFDGNRGQ